MWRTSRGERTLDGHEASLIRALVASAFEMLEWELDGGHPWRSGVALFDALPIAQKITLLAAVSNALLAKHAPCPPLDAVHEATVGMLYETLRRDIQGEIDAGSFYPDQDVTRLRRIALAAICQVDGNERDLPDAASDDIGEWEVVVQVLADAVLWDDDWDMPHAVMDKDPETARGIKEFLSIRDDYYIAVPAEPSDHDLAAARQFLSDIAADAP